VDFFPLVLGGIIENQMGSNCNQKKTQHTIYQISSVFIDYVFFLPTPEH
jgi:hypothetical protein